jgi:hypothetical protein
VVWYDTGPVRLAVWNTLEKGEKARGETAELGLVETWSWLALAGLRE